MLVFVAGRRESEVTVQILEQAGVPALVCHDVDELLKRMNEGAAAALIAEELLTPAAVGELDTWLAAQPAWSDFPLVIFSLGVGQSLRESAWLANATFLERPVRARSMLAAVRAAVRSRSRQYEVRHAIESRDTFLAMLGHELRNPLGAISLAGTLLTKRFASEEASKELQIISRQSAHLTRLVDDLLDVARITHGKVSLKKTPVRLEESVRTSFETLQARARQHLAHYELTVLDPELYVDADKQRLDQIFGNLLTNAIKYTPAAGTVKVVVRAEGEQAVVDITDDGVGLAPAMLARIFEPFAQVDSSLDRAQGGIGLGLALAHSIVERHGGTVRAASPGLDCGSTFSVHLPRIAAPAAEEHRSILANRVSSSQRIVVVEDSEDNRELLTALLAQLGHAVQVAPDGPIGLQRILEVVPDIAFVDIGLPGFDGFELARRARAAGYQATLIALTGYGSLADKQLALAAGFDLHLVKPVKEAELLQLLHINS
jgi:signal transduction histidine kinase/CheY-like chemotaxis protein